MKASSLNEIKKEIRTLDPEALQEICMRLGKFRKENKELMTYLLFEAHNEQAYIESVKEDLNNEFETLPRGGNTYFIKKTLRKILRFANRQIRYSGIRLTEVEIRIFFLLKMKEARVPLQSGTVLYNLYHQQLKKINLILKKLPEDLQADYERDLREIANLKTIDKI
jgi:hypothetical protein